DLSTMTLNLVPLYHQPSGWASKTGYGGILSHPILAYSSQFNFNHTESNRIVMTTVALIGYNIPSTLPVRMLSFAVSEVLGLGVPVSMVTGTGDMVLSHPDEYGYSGSTSPNTPQDMYPLGYHYIKPITSTNHAGYQISGILGGAGTMCTVMGFPIHLPMYWDHLLSKIQVQVVIYVDGVVVVANRQCTMISTGTVIGYELSLSHKVSVHAHVVRVYGLDIEASSNITAHGVS
ncbi:hypothetical protein G9A89_000265, partial [Geosiphon pyriformis]